MKKNSLRQSEKQNNETKGQYLLLHDQLNNQVHDEDLPVKTDDGLGIPAKIKIPQNVFFNGTVNVDETTYMFSPKVLDRANVIEFNEVDLEGYRDARIGDRGFRLKEPVVRKLFQDTKRRPNCTKEDYVEYTDLLNKLEEVDPLAKLFRLLKPYHLHFGYRVINEVSRFVVLASKQVNNFNLDDALDVQFLQKILPKLHGTKGKLQKPLNEIFWFCHDKDKDSNPTN